MIWPLLGCGADAASAPAAGQDTSPASDDDDTKTTPEAPSGDAEPDPTSTKTPLDAGRTSAGKDAGSSAAPRTDAGVKADAATDSADAATTGVDDALPHDAGLDGGVSPTDAGDAAAPDAATVDAQVQGPAPHVFKVDSKAEWTASGFKVEAGKCYLVEAKIDDQWLDLDVPADFSGWKDKSDARLALFAPFRRVVQADIGFYQFATCVNKKTDQCFPVGTSSTVCPKSAGELFFFINDVAGFESNNVGTATVSIRVK